VVRDAKEVSISFVSRRDDLQAEVIAISPEYDLAMLQLAGRSTGNTFLPPRDQNPSVFHTLATAYGYPAEYSYSLQPLAVEAMKDDYTPSGQLRTQDGKEAIFTRPDLQLITFTTVINNGVSGSPLLFNGNVVGVISGSWSIDGSGAWAIPIKYLSKLTPFTPDLSRAGGWPTVNLVKDFSKLGRSSVNLSAPVIIALGRFSQSMGKLKEVCSPLVDLVPKVNNILKDRLDKADTAVQAYGGATLASAHPGVPGTSVDLGLLLMLWQLAPCTQAFNDVHTDGDALTERVNSYSAALVHRPKNQQPRKPGLLQETKDHVRTVTELVNALDNADQDFVYSLPDTATIADYREAFQQDLNFMKDKDPAGLYTRTVAELETYYDVVNRLVASK
jgi:hypothetical protein